MSDSWFSFMDGFDVQAAAVRGLGFVPGFMGASQGAQVYDAIRRRQDAVEASSAAISQVAQVGRDVNTLFKGVGGDGDGAAPGSGLKYADAPTGATASDGPKILGYEDYPGDMPSSDVTMYNSTMPWTEWDDMSRKEKIATKETLYKAGYYGKSYVPVMNATRTSEDVEAMKKAMTDANLSNSGNWQLTATSMLQDDTGGAAKAARQQALERAAARATAIQGLRGYAYDNGIGLPEDFIAKKANQIAAGVKTQDEVYSQLTERFVAKQYPALAEDLKAGLTVREAAAPYITTYAQLLEVPDSQVKLNDPLLKQALQGVNDKGEPAYTPLWKFEEQVKQDKRWQYTDNAWEEVGSQAFEVMKMFGYAS